MERPPANRPLHILLVGHPRSQRVGRLGCHYPSSPSQRFHCQQNQKATDQPDEREGQKGQNDERDTPRHQSKCFLKISNIEAPLKDALSLLSG